jgi:hypothetical protein
MEKINEYILKKAIQSGICEPGAEIIAGIQTVDELLAYYRKGIDFCLSNNFPSNEDLLRLAGVDVLDKYGIWVDGGVNSINPDFSVALGRCTGLITINNYIVSHLFIKHQSTIAVNVSDNAFVVIDCFDDAAVSVTALENSKVLLNIYGNAKVNHTTQRNAIVKIVHKNKASY